MACFRGDKDITKKVRVNFLEQDTLSLLLPNIIKIFQTIKKIWRAQGSGLDICSGEITRTSREQELSFLHTTLLLDLVYVPIKYYQIISNSMVGDKTA